MKIIHTKSGKAYHLDPETQLEVERTNPFFNEAGEQTLPVTIPDSDHNRAILGYPEAPANRQKPSQNIDATIQDGEYFTACRQAILGAKRKEGIETTFYMNEGAFFGRIPDVRLTGIFAGETVPGITTVSQGISFCRNLLFNRHDIFAIFPVLTKGDDDEYPKWLNRLEYMKSNGDYLVNEGDNENAFNYFGFYNEFDRTETEGDYTISVAKGYCMTPFLRANYVLRSMFAHFGYTLEETFFETTHPFTDMVFVNNTDDTLVNGDIRLTDLIPDMMCSTLLNVYRKKFGCEFIPDEPNKTVKIEFLKDILSGDASADLSGCVDGELGLAFPGIYRQLKISSKESVKEGDQYDSVAELVSKFPAAYMDASSGNYYRRGVSADIGGSVTDTTELVASAAIPYLAEEKNEEESVEVPDCAIVMKKPKFKELAERKPGNSNPLLKYPYKRHSGEFPHPYIGETRALNSTVVYNDKENDDSVREKDTTAKNDEQLPMLAFVYPDTTVVSHNLGTVHNYTPFYRKLSDYSLLYNGPDGIFEKFYRPYDDILRNSMHTVTANLLLSGHQKLTIPAHRKVIIKSQELLINKLAFTLGGKNEPKESEFYTTHLYEPVESVLPEAERIPVDYGYYNIRHFWSIRVDRKNISQSEYNASPHKGTSIPVFYLPAPDTGKYNPGDVFTEKELASTFTLKDGTQVYLLITLAVVLV
ncbi:MAG: hypothetical protein LBL07_02580 [Tannerella sp.]|jgi:hypothetical protein|nr:hypothetical protein [Tannerella sp.]